MTRRGYYAKCPHCQALYATQRDYVRHLLDEAGPRGVTTNEFLRWHAGSRFGARVHELRHEEGLVITEDNEHYTLHAGGVVAGSVASPNPVAGAPGARFGTGHQTNGWEHTWMCPRCAYAACDGPVCPRGHDAIAGWHLDLSTTGAVVEDDVFSPMAEAA